MTNEELTIEALAGNLLYGIYYIHLRNEKGDKTICNIQLSSLMARQPSRNYKYPFCEDCFPNE